MRFMGKVRKSKRVDPLGFISEHGVIHSSLFERVRQLESSGLVELTCPAEVREEERLAPSLMAPSRYGGPGGTRALLLKNKRTRSRSGRGALFWFQSDFERVLSGSGLNSGTSQLDVAEAE